MKMTGNGEPDEEVPCIELLRAVGKLYYIGMGLSMAKPGHETGWAVSVLIRDIMKDLEKAEKSCASEGDGLAARGLGIVKMLENLLTPYWAGVRDENPAFIGGYLVAVASTAMFVSPPEPKSIKCPGKKLFHIDRIYMARDAAGPRTAVFHAATMVNREETDVLLVIGTEEKQVTAVTWRRGRILDVNTQTLDEAVETGRIGNIEVDPEVLRRLYAHTAGKMPLWEVCPRSREGAGAAARRGP